jgi:calcineurin-like phosphoesterase family protein
MTKYVISDLHLGHKNILTFAGALRGGTTSEEHDAWIIDQINSVVTKHDLLYILGDVAFNLEHLKKLKRLRCKQLILAKGNHDANNYRNYMDYFQEMVGICSLRGTFWLTHAPIHPQELRGRMNIHGHVHQNSILGTDGLPDPRYINACVEMTYGVPQNLDKLLERHFDEVVANKAALRILKAHADIEL